jgi:carbamoyltransferase
MSYFNFATGLTMTNKKFDALFGGPARAPESDLTQREMDLAASVQKVTEDVVCRLARGIAKETGEKNLCLAGGVALNCVANGILLREKIFDNIWIQPAAGDAGGALGAALANWYRHHATDRRRPEGRDAMRGSYLGPCFSDSEIRAELTKMGAVFHQKDKETLTDVVASALAEGKAIGWMQGRMEFGPRALGGRSILADPRSGMMQKQLNLKVKYRESFRPFAPSVLREHIGEWFDHDDDSPYMLLVADVSKSKRIAVTDEEQSRFGIDKLNVQRSSIPAVTHVDFSARIQTVHQDTNPEYHALISKFYQKTACPIVVNTSFNVRGEPIVCSPEDAFKCFMGTELDVLAVGNFVLFKDEQDSALRMNYEQRYELD